MKSGDSLYLVDGKGNLYKGNVISIDKKNIVTVKIYDITRNYGKRNYKLHIAIAPTKNIDRFEWFIEKSAEIGIDEITPLLCDRSERKNIRNDRLEKILISAIKQSVNAYLPVLHPLIRFNDFINQCNADNKFIAHCMTGDKPHLLKVRNEGNSFTVLVGPEGDFSDQEIMSAQNKNYIPVSLGSNRLRTETAGIAVCQIISDRDALRSG